MRRLLALAVLVAACGGTAATLAPTGTPTRAATPAPTPSARSFAAACGAALNDLLVFGSETSDMLQAILDADANEYLAKLARVNLLAEQAVDRLPDGYREQTALRLFAERLAVVRALATTEGDEMIDIVPFSEAMVELLDVTPALEACGD